jgi:glycosyltransferase involved in cell wall biosynthesis
VEALGAAYAASRKHNAFFAFDAEDFHSGELPDGRDAKQRARIEYLESKYLPLCDYITAASDGIADALAEKYNISRPEVILNVFPLEPLPSEHQERRTENQEPVIKLYWYSQVIGPGRGLEETILALNKLYWPCQLHLRGQLLDDFDTTLRGMAHESGSKGKLFLHQPAPPEDLVHLAAEHDIGLALETGESRNRLLCVTNKLFVYMLAGLAIVATDTPGQATIMNQAPGAGMTCHMRNPESLAEAIGKLISNPAKLAEGRKASRQAAEQRFNWDIEKKKLVRIVEKLQN